MTPEEPTRVFISYSQDSQAHADDVLALANRLRNGGIDCSIDQYEESPREGWPRWMDRQIRESKFVLVVCSEFYLNKLLGKVKPTEGLGVKWEGNLVYQHLYNNDANLTFVPVLLTNSKPEHIPVPLQGVTYYRPANQTDFDRLYWRLRGLPLKTKPPLGTLEPLPTKERKTNPGLFLTGFIDIHLWDAAVWKGVLYFCVKDQPPLMAFFFEHEKPAVRIFLNWHTRIGDADSYEEMRLSIVEGDVPGYAPGYTVHISANIDNILRRTDDLGLNVPNEQVAVLSRMLRMNPEPGSQNLETFKHAFHRFGCFKLCPAVAGPHGVKLLPFSVLKREVLFRHVSDIKAEDDMDGAILAKAHTKWKP